jgi:hypothetical protein
MSFVVSFKNMRLNVFHNVLWRPLRICCNGNFLLLREDVGFFTESTRKIKCGWSGTNSSNSWAATCGLYFIAAVTTLLASRPRKDFTSSFPPPPPSRAAPSQVNSRLVARYFRASLIVANTHVDGQPAEVREGGK